MSRSCSVSSAHAVHSDVMHSNGCGSAASIICRSVAFNVFSIGQTPGLRARVLYPVRRSVPWCVVGGLETLDESLTDRVEAIGPDGQRLSRLAIGEYGVDEDVL